LEVVRRALAEAEPFRSFGLRIKIGTVVTPLNLAELPKMAEFLQQLQPNIWKWYQVRPRGAASRDYSALFVDETTIRAAEQKIRTTFPGIALHVSLATDTIGAHFIVNPDGEIVIPMLQRYLSFGRLVKDNAICESVWNSALAALNRANHKTNNMETFPSEESFVLQEF